MLTDLWLTKLTFCINVPTYGLAVGCTSFGFSFRCIPIIATFFSDGKFLPAVLNEIFVANPGLYSFVLLSRFAVSFTS